MMKDILEAVDHVDVFGMPLPKVASLIIGRPGTAVNLTFRRERDGGHLQVRS